jgi:Nuclease-related domain
MSRAGKNIRTLALRRRFKAIQLFVATAGLGYIPFLGNSFLHQLSLTTKTVMALPAWTYLACFSLAILTLFSGLHIWKRANHADQGATGEEDIAAILKPLSNQGWQIEYGIRDRRLGDIDILLLSPNKRAYTIDVKAHKGQVRSQDGRLYRQYGQTRYSFEKDFLSQAKQQAIAMKEQKGLRFVTPIVVFSAASVEISANPVSHVYVLGKETLLSQLRSLERM